MIHTESQANEPRNFAEGDILLFFLCVFMVRTQATLA